MVIEGVEVGRTAEAVEFVSDGNRAVTMERLGERGSRIPTIGQWVVGPDVTRERAPARDAPDDPDPALACDGRCVRPPLRNRCDRSRAIETDVVALGRGSRRPSDDINGTAEHRSRRKRARLQEGSCSRPGPGSRVESIDARKILSVGRAADETERAMFMARNRHGFRATPRRRKAGGCAARGREGQDERDRQITNHRPPSSSAGTPFALPRAPASALRSL